VPCAQVHEDSTNLDQRYARNRLRHAVFPHLTGINAGAVDHMVAAAELLQHVDELMTHLAAGMTQRALVPCCLVDRQHTEQHAKQRLGQQHTPEQQHQQLALAADVSRLPKALQYGVVRAWLQQQHASQQQPRRRRQRQQQAAQGSAAVSLVKVQEVVRLLQPGSNTGARSSTLWGDSSVVLHQGLLLLLNKQEMQRLLARELHVQRVLSWYVCDSSCLDQRS
jgi:hypothetical protein